MEIIHLILGKANPERMNGVNKVVHEMASNQFQRGYAVSVWGITTDPVHNYPTRNFTTRLYRKFRNPFKADPALLEDLGARKGNIVVHIHGAFLPIFYTISGFLYKNGIPFILTPHSTYNKVMMKKNALMKKVYFALFERKLLDRADAVHLLGKTEWEGLEAIYHNQKSLLLPYGFTRVENESAAAPDKFKVFTITYCGRLAIYPKGLDILLKGFSLFHLGCPHSQLLILGDGPEMGRLKKMAHELKISNAVQFKGKVFGKEKVELLRKSHLFAHPSRTDGLPATIVEAASLGIPCIVSDATNTGDFITRFDAGYAMSENTAEILWKGLNKMHHRMVFENGQDALRQHALKMIDEAFDWTTLLKQFNQVYETALERARNREENNMLSTTEGQIA